MRWPTGRLAAVALVLIASISIQSGAAVAISLFDRVGPAGAVLLRNALAVPILFAIWRPRIAERSRADLRLALAFGVALGLMNLSIYAAIDRLPLGVAITIETLGPLGVAVATGKGRSSLLWAGLAALGVAALAGPFGGSLNALGVLFASLAACAWAAYILLGRQLGRVYPGASGLTIGVAIAMLIQLPTGIASGGADLVAPEVLAVALAVATLSTVIPYAAEIEALRRLPAATFGVLMSLEPAIAGLIGLIALDQGLDAGEVIGIVLVVAASAGAIRTAQTVPPIIE